MTGTKLIESAFKANQRNAAAANALCDIFLRKGQYKRVSPALSAYFIAISLGLTPFATVYRSQALKLAERTIQFADTVTLLNEGYIRAGRVCHSEGSYEDATKHFKVAASGMPKNVLAAIGLAQMQMRNGTLIL